MPTPRADSPPSGTVTFLFTDIEGSTQLWESQPDTMRVAVARHDALLRGVIAASGGHVFKTVGDAFCAAFADAGDAATAALAVQAAIADEPWPAQARIKVRMAVHTGVVQSRDGDYFGPPVNRVARILATAHGGQTLLSQATLDAAGPLPQGASLRDLGTHRLKDLARPEHVFELRQAGLDVAFPPIRSLSTHPNNLPQQITTFVGRDREIADVEALLAEHRLLTLTGAGGSGKTRLALQVAAEVLPSFPDGAWLVELAPVADARLVAQAVNVALGVAETPGEPFLDSTVRHLEGKTVLLLLDNCEHVLDASVAVANALIRRCAGVRVLATSREALGIAGEQRYPVRSLSAHDSALLFADRARLVQVEFAVSERNARAVASICGRLDGIPLAIELAAARLATLTVEEIDARLDRRFALLTGGSRAVLPRQRTLRALIDWSYELLDAREQSMLQQLAVFAGGFSLQRAEQTFAAEYEDALDLVASLSGKSLVVRDQADDASRCLLLETVREYALEKLVASGREQEARNRHRDYCLALAEGTSEQFGAQQAAWLDARAAEHENLRAALAWTLADVQPDAALRICGSLLQYWATRGYFAEGRDWCARAVRMPASAGYPRERAKALHTAGSLAYYQADYAAAHAAFTASLGIHRQLGDAAGVAAGTNNLANVAIGQGDYETARAMHEANLQAAREQGDEGAIANAILGLGIVCDARGDHAGARSRFEECLAIRRRMGDRRGIAVALNNLANVAFELGDLASTQSLHEEGLAIRRELGDRRGIALSLGNLADFAFEQGDLAQARALAAESLQIAQEIGDERQIAHALDRLAAVHAGHARFSATARILGFLEAKGAAANLELAARARDGVGDGATFDRAWREGHALTLEQAIAVATASA